MSDPLTWTAEGRPLVDGGAEGSALILSEPLSMWGGLDPLTGLIIDERHPQRGQSVTGTLLVMPSGRGSSSSSSVLAEALRNRRGPAAIVLLTADQIVVLGALVMELLDGIVCPVVVLQGTDYARLRTGDAVVVSPGGRLSVSRRV